MASEITINLVDEASGQLEKLRVKLRGVTREVKERTPLGQDTIKALERIAYNIGREVGSSLRAVGISGAFVSGGIVAVLAKIAASLDNFASNAVQQHSVAREVGITYEQFERLVLAAKARGLTDEQAREGVEKLTRSIRDLDRGSMSDTFQKLEEAGANASGVRIARKFQQSLAENGLYNTIIEVLGHIESKAGQGTDDGNYAAKILTESMGLDSAAWHGLLETLDKIKRVAVPSEEKSREYLKERRKLDIELTRLKNKIMAEFLPPMTALLQGLRDWFTSENTEKFRRYIKSIVEAILAFPWKKLRDLIDNVLSWVGEQIVLFSEDLANFIEDIEKFFRMVDAWRGTAIFNHAREKPVPFPEIGGLGQSPFPQQPGGEAPASTEEPVQSTGPIEPVPIPLDEIEVDADAPPIQRFTDSEIQLPPGPPSAGEMQNALELGDGRMRQLRSRPQGFATLKELDISDSRLTRQTDLLAFEMRRFTDVVRDIRGGAGGGSSDGGVSEKARTRPLATKAGGSGDKTTQQASGQTEDQRAAAGKDVAPGVPAPGRHTVKATLFGNYSTAEGSKIGGWVDKDDMYTSGPKKGQPKPNWGGYGHDIPGVSLPYKGSAGRAEKQEGMLVRVWSPDGKQSYIARQVDIGPSQKNPKSRDKGLDITAALAEKLGYVQTSEQSKQTGRPKFPGIQTLQYEVIRPEDIMRHRDEMAAEQEQLEKDRKTIAESSGNEFDSKASTPKGNMAINVNVNAPRGTTADVSVDPKADYDTKITMQRRILTGSLEEAAMQ